MKAIEDAIGFFVVVCAIVLILWAFAAAPQSRDPLCIRTVDGQSVCTPITDGS